MNRHWTAIHARYPYTSAKTWWTRYHLLGRKIARQGAQPTGSDVRVAVILARSAPQGSAADAAVTSMEWITHGHKAPYNLPRAS